MTPEEELQAHALFATRQRARQRAIEDCLKAALAVEATYDGMVLKERILAAIRAVDA